MARIGYLNFDLLIEGAEEGYTARVLNSPAGQGSAHFSLPFSELELENFLLRVGRTRRGRRRLESPEMQAAKRIGGQLFEAVFRDAVMGCFLGSVDQARQRQAGLRIRLRLQDAPELADHPWEYLYNPTLNRFLSLSVETPLVRYLDLPERIQPLAVKPPLRILAMISSPGDHPPLDVEQEWAKLGEALGDLEQRGLVALERLEQATLSALQRRLRRKEYHVFHFVGHGAFDRQAQDGVLLLEDEEGRGRPVSGQNLGTMLHDERTLRLAILNACEGARTSRVDPFAGAAQSLVQQGIPAVIAMQFEITDEAAITLAHEFYTALADGYPVDAALAEARKAIFAQENDVEWGTPVLYMRAPDGRIFDVERVSGAEREREEARAAVPSPRARPRRTRRRLWVTIAAALAALLLVAGGGYLATREFIPALLGPTPTQLSALAPSPTSAPTQTQTRVPTPTLEPTSTSPPPTLTPTPASPTPPPPTPTPTPTMPATQPPATATPTQTPLRGRIAFMSDRGGFTEIYVMNADGSGVTNLTNTPNDSELAPAWSPDGTRIAFAATRGDHYDIYVMNGDGSGVTRLTNDPAYDTAPAWSPDGTRIAFMSSPDRDDFEIHVMNADGSGMANLSNNPTGDDSDPSWSPDGRYITFSSSRDGLKDIYIVDVDVALESQESDAINLTNDSASDGQPAWSPDGRYIAFMSNRDGSWDICVVDVDAALEDPGSSVTNLTNDSAADSYPTWSPDGTRIAFSSKHGGDYDIYVMNADGSGAINLTNNPAHDSTPTWSQ